VLICLTAIATAIVPVHAQTRYRDERASASAGVFTPQAHLHTDSVYRDLSSAEGARGG
jgi:hypothetical protein